MCSADEPTPDGQERRTYIGEHRFNRRSNKSEVKPEEEVVTVAVPPLIDLETFEAVQRRLQVNNPKVTPPRRQRSEPADRHLPLQQLRRCDDAPHRQERPLSLLCLFDPRAAG
ncbi:hypothetical protein KL86PLE_41426 [uncultured Pleomorphomonas sp.]|uniref:Recombinase domain-containing protein n=1 Tax=uncultured Pleomorphomonas sp. TaxID=442121 RepID=A0A212LJ92_9HYPH|nr:recombinase family protein [uncultured Pleomorphomonas sp.]SCM77621.1 hypothetical protein KL86PLE_41426 [uncultured Pleomorphomonas sp.]